MPTARSTAHIDRLLRSRREPDDADADRLALALSAVADVPLEILVVDDESELRDMLSRLFARQGHSVTTVADGRAAIDRASTDRFDVVLLDVALASGPDGFEVCRTLRARRNVVPIIMLTALDSEADAVLGLRPAPTTTSRSRSARPSCAAASARCCGARARARSATRC